MSVAKKKSPYEVLGVGEKSDGETIKRAYRKRSRETHPDRGGSSEQFREVSTAFVLLSDPERRRRYDETGDESKSRDTWQEELGTAFLKTLQELYQQGRVETSDMVRITRSKLEAEIGSLMTGIKELEKARKVLDASIRRLKDGEGFLTHLLRSEIVKAHSKTAELTAKRDGLEKAVAYLKKCEFEFDKDDHKSTPTFTMWTTVTS